MDFPTTPVLDDFNRADIQPLDGSWEVPAGVAIDPLLLSTLQAVNTLNPLFSIGLWTGSVPTADCEVFLTLKTVPAYDTGLSNSVMLLSNAKYIPENAQWRANALFVAVAGGVGHIGIGGFYADGGGWGGGIDRWFSTGPLSSGDSFLLRTAGGRRIALYRPVGGEWSRIGQVESVYQPEAGQLGVCLVGPGLTGELDENLDPIEAALAIDDFGGGDAAPDQIAAPTQLSAQATSAPRVDLTWTDNASDETGFEIERGADGLLFDLIATVAADATTYSDLSVTAGQHYYYRVRATSDAVDSDYSNIADAVTPVAAPIDLAARAILSTHVELTWTDVNGVDGYRVERGLDGLTFAEIAGVANGVTQLADTELSGHAVMPQTVYYYRVRAYIGAVYSAYSNVVSVITPLGGFMIDAIAVAVIDALSANHSLDAIKLFIDGGTPMPVPQDKHPFVEVIIGEETPVDELTGGVSERSYRGLLTFTAQLTQTARADWLDPVEGDARRARVGSYSLIKRLVMTAQVELQREVHQDLGELITAIDVDALTVREAVTAFRLDGSIVYGLDDRANNYENFGSIPFVVETERTIT